MLNLITLLFSIAALLGVIMAITIIKDKKVNRKVAYVHGAGAAVPLVLLIVYSLQNPEHSPVVSIIIFIMAALGGFYLFANDLRKKPGPVAVVLIHGILAVVAFLLLLKFVMA